MTKKDYIEIGRVVGMTLAKIKMLNDTAGVFADFIEDLCYVFSKDNYRFDKIKFKQYINEVSKKYEMILKKGGM